MKKNINPLDYNVNSDYRVCIRNLSTDKFEEVTVVEKNKLFNIPETYFDKGILGYLFKIQTKDSTKKWKDTIRYFYFLDLNKFWTEKIEYSDQAVLEMIKYYYGNSNTWHKSHITYSFN